ncbi:hypothetical protein D3C76_1575840 [compost metagenome]
MGSVVEKLRPYRRISSGYSTKYSELPATISGASARSCAGRALRPANTEGGAPVALKIGARLW